MRLLSIKGRAQLRFDALEDAAPTVAAALITAAATSAADSTKIASLSASAVAALSAVSANSAGATIARVSTAASFPSAAAGHAATIAPECNKHGSSHGVCDWNSRLCRSADAVAALLK